MSDDCSIRPDTGSSSRSRRFRLVLYTTVRLGVSIFWFADNVSFRFSVRGYGSVFREYAVPNNDFEFLMWWLCT